MSKHDKLGRRQLLTSATAAGMMARLSVTPAAAYDRVKCTLKPDPGDWNCSKILPISRSDAKLPTGHDARQLWAFAWPPSVDIAKDNGINLYISSPWPKLTVEVFNALWFDYDNWHGQQNGLLAERPFDESFSRDHTWEGEDINGCDWKHVRLEVNHRGLLALRVHPLDSMDWYNTFVVIVPVRDSKNTHRILFQTAFFTDHAYNHWGGHSYYTKRDSHLSPVAVSLKRPIFTGDLGQDGRGVRSHMFALELKFLRWLANEKVGNSWMSPYVDYCTNWDLHNDESVISGSHKLLITVGHHEYWTQSMFKNMRSAIEGGKNYANLGGNTCWRRVTYCNETHRLVLERPNVNIGKYCDFWQRDRQYWHYNQDPFYSDLMLLGVSTAWGSVQDPTPAPAMRGEFRLAVDPRTRGEWWSFPLSGLNAAVKVNDQFGSDTIKDETDSARIRLTAKGAALDYDSYDEPPRKPDSKLLAWSPLLHAHSAAHCGFDLCDRVLPGAAVVCNRVGKGIVFSAGTIHWAAGLRPTKLTAGWKPDAPPLDWTKKQQLENLVSLMTRNTVLALAEFT